LFFASNRPLDNASKTKKDFDIWYVTRANKNTPWSKPINLGAPVNTELNEFYPTLSKNNNLYLTIDSPNGLGKDDIYISKWDGNNYTKPELLSENINSNGYEFNAFISEDESFLLYTKYGTKDGYGSGDLYIATKDENGNWQKSKNLGEAINSRYMEYCPFYNSNEQTLYFTSRRNSLKPKSFDSIDDFINYTSNGENGLSKIYKVKVKL
jgi:WD40-like Beta Propeller Repeat.